MRKNLYNYHVVDRFVSGALDKGYDVYQLNEGTLGSGDWLVLSHDDRPSYVIVEIALNSWQSAHWILSSENIDAKTAWTLLTRFANEAHEYQDELEKITKQTSSRRNEAFVRELLLQGYKAIRAESDGLTGVLLQSPDKRPDYAAYDRFSDGAIVSRMLKETFPVAEIWDAMVSFGMMAYELLLGLEEVA